MRKTSYKLASEKGAASLIFILLVSMVVLATNTEVIKAVKNAQEIDTAMNAITHAESATLTAADAFRMYLEDIEANDIRNLSGDYDIEMDAIFGSITAENITVVETSPNVFQIDSTFVNKHAAARSSAKLQIVYNVTSESAAPVGWPTSATVNFAGDLNISGGIELLNNGDPVDLAVDGNVTLGGVSVNPINELRTSGTVTVTSRVFIDRILADDDVTLANTQSNIVRTMGDFLATGDASVGSVQANGDVEIRASGRFDQVSTPKNITINSGGAGQGALTAGESINAISSGSIDSAMAVGDISIGNWFTVDSAMSMGDITCPSQWWTSTNSLSANGSLINCPASSASLYAEAGLSNTVTPPEALTPLALHTPPIDVWTLIDDVNYFVEYDTDLGRIKVIVKSVNGFTDDAEYTLANFTASGPPYMDYLCEVVNSSGNCSNPTTPTLPICFGQSLYNNCISYNSSTNTFTVNPNQIVPGVVFFDGNLSLGNGHSITTILASGNITTSGQFEHWAANYGGYSKICLAEASHAKNSVQARYTEAYSTHYPTNLCDIANSDYIPINTGNIGLAAGGVNPDLRANPDGLYSGGDISLGASTTTVGAVLAGNILKTTGQVEIQGLVASGALGDEISGDNSLGNSTTIDFSGGGDYVASELPEMGEALPAGPDETTATVLWSRPL